MPDSRIKEFIDEYHKSFFIFYGRKPMITGKEAARVQSMWKWVDENTVDQMKIYNALWNFFSDQGFVKDQAHPIELFFKGINKYMQPQKKTIEQIGQENIDKAKKMFVESQNKSDERFKIEEKTPKDFQEYFELRYSKDEFGCSEWIKKQRSMLNLSDAMKNKESKVYQLWVKEGKAAREHFGDELVSKLWRAAEQTKKPISEQIKKAKEIEVNS